jgi:hypothetical protein
MKPILDTDDILQLCPICFRLIERNAQLALIGSGTIVRNHQLKEKPIQNLRVMHIGCSEKERL